MWAEWRDSLKLPKRHLNQWPLPSAHVLLPTALSCFPRTSYYIIFVAITSVDQDWFRPVLFTLVKDIYEINLTVTKVWNNVETGDIKSIPWSKPEFCKLTNFLTPFWRVELQDPNELFLAQIRALQPNKIFFSVFLKNLMPSICFFMLLMLYLTLKYTL